jgi:hypothetical protein
MGPIACIAIALNVQLRVQATNRASCLLVGVRFYLDCCHAVLSYELSLALLYALLGCVC